MGFVRLISVANDGSQEVVCRLFSDNGGPVYAVPHNAHARTVMQHPIPADGKWVTVEDGDEFLAALSSRYCGSRFFATEMEDD